MVLGGLGGSLAAGAAAFALFDDADTVLLITFAGQFVGHLAVIWLIARSRGLGAASFGFELRTTDLFYLGLGIGLQMLVAIVFIPFQQFLVPDGGPSQELIDMFSRLRSSGSRMAMMGIATFLAPVTEEIMFRGILFRALAGRSSRVVIVVTAAVFALFHLAGATSVGAGVLIFAQIFLVGLVLGRLTVRHGRIGPAVFVHAGFNLLTTLILLAPPELLEMLEAAR